MERQGVNVMTEHKQIKQMASDMDYACTKKDLYPSDAKEIAKALYLLDYRKLPKNSVVLSTEEWKQIKNSLYYNKEELEKKLQRERKKTVKEILQKVKEKALSHCRTINCYELKFIEETIDELLEEYVK